MSYINYGIEPGLVEKIKLKLKNPVIKDRVKAALDGVTKSQLQDPAAVGKLLTRISAIVGVSLSERERNNIIRFVIAQQIDPKNTFHLIRLWGMFR